MSILDDLKNQQTPDPPSPASDRSAEVIETLNKQTEALNSVIERVRSLESQVSKLSDSRASASTPSASSVNAMENSLNEIESTLKVFVNALDGKGLREATQTLTTEAARIREAGTTVTKSLGQQVAVNKKLLDRADHTMRTVEEQAAASIDQASARGVKSINQAAVRAGDIIGERITQNLTAVNERAEKITARAEKIDSRQAWSAAAAMALALLPVATVVAGVWMSFSGLVAAFQWAGGAISTWGTVGRFLVAGGGTLAALAGLVWCVRWVAGVVGVWRDRGMPSWPRWLRRR